MMCLFRHFLILTTYSVFVMTAPNNNKDAIGFPESEENPLLLNKQNRMPVFIPSRCPENELFYPGDQRDDWICDCRPGYLYHPNSDACWPAYQRGPCALNEYLILPPGTVIPVCTPSPCKSDLMVLWRGKCEKLGTTTPCGVEKFPAEALWVNATTLTVECLQINLDYKSTVELIYETHISCCPGCKRFIQNKCTPTQV